MEEEFGVIIADGHPLLRAGVKSVLQNLEGFKVLGEASDWREAMTLMKEVKPDVVVLDLSLPQGGGVRSIREMQRAFPGVVSIVLSSHSNEEHVLASLDAGAKGYVLKEDPLLEVCKALQSACHGQTYLSANTAHELATGYLSARRAGKVPTVLEALTAREREVFHLVGGGKKNREVAEHLFISIKTVEKHRANIMRKLQLNSAHDLRLLWRKLGFGS
ncbi:response regulator [Paucidesulfovibrio longus]|uniref:response regulator n=1 Tax=Paucidesulfovibrio longus TaxID=889 RepID=UPI0003B624B2|nr:response regulator transcription factor [Paucidesulfovibrio longus]